MIVRTGKDVENGRPLPGDPHPGRSQGILQFLRMVAVVTHDGNMSQLRRVCKCQMQIILNCIDFCKSFALDIILSEQPRRCLASTPGD